MSKIEVSRTAPVPLADLVAMNTEVEQDVRAAWDGIIASSGFIGGEAVSQFEELWAGYCGTDHAIMGGSLPGGDRTSAKKAALKVLEKFDKMPDMKDEAAEYRSYVNAL